MRSVYTFNYFSTKPGEFLILFCVDRNKHTTSYLAQAAIIAALYVVLTWLTNLLGLAGGQVQVRLSEMLCVLPVFTGTAVPGLFAGCLLANLLTGGAPADIIGGSLITLAAAFLTYRLRQHKYLSLLPPIVLNGAFIPLILRYAYGIKPLWLSFITVTAGEVISAGILGMILFKVLSKHRQQLFPH